MFVYDIVCDKCNVNFLASLFKLNTTESDLKSESTILSQI
jgi:hypothetical protein